MVDAEHQPRLIEARLVVARDLDLDLELAPAKGVEIGRVIDRKAVVRYAPVIGPRRNIHNQSSILDLPVVGLVEPLHLLQSL